MADGVSVYARLTLGTNVSVNTVLSPAFAAPAFDYTASTIDGLASLGSQNDQTVSVTTGGIAVTLPPANTYLYVAVIVDDSVNPQSITVAATVKNPSTTGTANILAYASPTLPYFGAFTVSSAALDLYNNGTGTTRVRVLWWQP